MINIIDLCVSFDTKQVLNNITIDFSDKMIHGIVGLNGAGKSTFFNVLTNTIKPNSGKLIFNGNKLTKKDTGYLETTNYFYSGITGKEYLDIFKQTNTNFNLLELQHFMKLPLNELTENYSTGMRKKLALLGILKQDKPIFLLDEPFNGLDLETNKVLELIISVLKEKNKTIFVSSHIIDPLLAICDEIHFLEDGKFKKTYKKPEFEKIEDELFGQLKEQMQTIVKKSI